MKEMFIYLVILFVISVIIDVALSFYRKIICNKLMNLLLNDKIVEFDELLSKKSAKFFVPYYNSLVLKMNKAVKIGDVDLMNETMNEFSNIKLKDSQCLFVYSKAFSYYLSMGDNKRLNICFKKINDCKDCPTKQYIKMVYNTIVEKKWDYLQLALAMLEKVSGEDKENLKVLIGQMFQNKGDKKEAEKYL